MPDYALGRLLRDAEDAIDKPRPKAATVDRLIDCIPDVRSFAAARCEAGRLEWSRLRMALQDIRTAIKLIERGAELDATSETLRAIWPGRLSRESKDEQKLRFMVLSWALEHPVEGLVKDYKALCGVAVDQAGWLVRSRGSDTVRVYLDFVGTLIANEELEALEVVLRSPGYDGTVRYSLDWGPTYQVSFANFAGVVGTGWALALRERLARSPEVSPFPPAPRASAEDSEARTTRYREVVVPARELEQLIVGRKVEGACALIRALAPGQLTKVLSFPMRHRRPGRDPYFQTAVGAAIGTQQTRLVAEMLRAGWPPTDDAITYLVEADLQAGMMGASLKALEAGGVSLAGWLERAAVRWDPPTECVYMEVFLAKQSQAEQRLCIDACKGRLSGRTAEELLRWLEGLRRLWAWEERAGLESKPEADHDRLLEALQTGSSRDSRRWVDANDGGRERRCYAQVWAAMPAGHPAIDFENACCIPEAALELLERGHEPGLQGPDLEYCIGRLLVRLPEEQHPRLLRIVNAHGGRLCRKLWASGSMVTQLWDATKDKINHWWRRDLGRGRLRFDRWPEILEPALRTLSRTEGYSERVRPCEDAETSLIEYIELQLARRSGLEACGWTEGSRQVVEFVEGIRWSADRAAWAGAVARGTQRRR